MTKFKHSNIFEDHLKIAKQKFIEKYERDPSFYELISFYQMLFKYFYS